MAQSTQGGGGVLEKKFTELLLKADIQINGTRPWDIQVHNPNFYRRALTQGSLGIGEAYMDGWWDCKEIDQMIFRALRAKLDKEFRGMLSPQVLFHIIHAFVMNAQSAGRAFEVGEKHYDTGNKLFENMLDTRMVYTCGYWKNADNLDDAQVAKLDLVCRKIGLKAGQRVLDIGCGWGSFAKFAAEKYGATVVGVTVSEEQAEYAKESCKGLPVEIRLQDYRDVNEKFDHIISLGMFEHVGVKNYRTYMEVVHRCLKDDGLFLLHVIGMNVSEITNDPWMNKYIFPNAMSPSPKQIAAAIEGLFILEDWHCFGNDYYRTLTAWYDNFVKNWPKIEKDYDQRFYRMWTYALKIGAGSHLTGSDSSLWQIVLSKNGIPEGYVSIR